MAKRKKIKEPFIRPSKKLSTDIQIALAIDYNQGMSINNLVAKYDIPQLKIKKAVYNQTISDQAKKIIKIKNSMPQEIKNSNPLHHALLILEGECFFCSTRQCYIYKKRPIAIKDIIFLANQILARRGHNLINYV